MKVTDERQEQQSSLGGDAWGNILANCLWLITFFLILGFFWQSIGSILSN